LIVCIFGVIPLKPADAEIHAHAAGAAWLADQANHSPAKKPEDRRIALVIGNRGYGDAPLGTPLNDARALGAALAARGFDVMRVEDADARQMAEAIRAFQQRLESGGVGLFYFAGHGFRVGGRTLLAAVDARRESPSTLITKSIDLHAVLQGMSPQRPGKLNLVILDTCLINPFQGGIERLPPAPERTLIAYATSPGALAWDGVSHGLYTGELLRIMRSGNQDLHALLVQAASAVERHTERRQVPQVMFEPAVDPLRLASAHRPDDDAFRFDTMRSRAILPKDSAEQYELAFWDSIKDSDHAADYEAYLQAYPKGRFAALAKARIARLKAKADAAQDKPAPAAKSPERQPAAKAPRTEQPPQAKPAPPAKAEPKQAKPAAPEKDEPKQAATPGPDRSSGGSAGVAEVKDCPDCPVLVSLPGGTFTMGSNTGDPSEKPAHRVTIETPFAIGRYEVTVEQWSACIAGGGCPRLAPEPNQQPKAPVREVSWDDAQQYVQWLSKTTGKNYRLPTEAEWEYAARGGTSTKFWWGDQMSAGKANCKDCGPPWSQDGPVSAGSFAANPFGLHDMNGSVWEWVADCWHNSYKGAPDSGRAWGDVSSCRERVIRGGSWREGASYMPVTTRFKYAASVRQMQNGFRVARDMK
jgi:formylglycine-generating enzyme required for sulfatase activity